jgi:hypothetical protein
MIVDIIAIGLIAAAATITAFVVPKNIKRKELEKLRERESLDDEAVYSIFYSDAGLPETQIATIWQEISDTLHVPADRMRPSDQFGIDVGVYWITSDDLDVLAVKGSKRAADLGLTVDFGKISTVDEYIRCFGPIRPCAQA